MGLRVVRPDRDRPSVLHHCVIEPALIGQDVAHLEMRFGVAGINFERPLVKCGRFIDFALLRERAAQISDGVDMAGAEDQGAFQVGHSLLDSALRFKRDAQIVVCVCGIRPQEKRPLEQHRGLVDSSGPEMLQGLIEYRLKVP